MNQNVKVKFCFDKSTYFERSKSVSFLSSSKTPAFNSFTPHWLILIFCTASPPPTKLTSPPFRWLPAISNEWAAVHAVRDATIWSSGVRVSVILTTFGPYALGRQYSLGSAVSGVGRLLDLIVRSHSVYTGIDRRDT